MKKDTAHNAKRPSKSRTKAAGSSVDTCADGNASGARQDCLSQSRVETPWWIVLVTSLIAIGFSWVVILILLIED